MSRLELAATVAWKQWGDAFALITRCFHCNQIRPCRGKRRRRMVCLDCFDQGNR